jgi:hypothetical protein
VAAGRARLGVFVDDDDDLDPVAERGLVGVVAVNPQAERLLVPGD